MALEKRFYAVPPQAFTVDGTVNGVITIAANACTLFKVKMRVILTATGLPDLAVEIKEIDSEDNIQVGPFAGQLNIPGQNTGITARTNISAYTVALGAAIFADEQKRPAIDNIEIVRAVYSEEPACAQRGILVDDCGATINATNPLPINIISTSQIPFTLGALTLPAAVLQFLSALTYNQVTSATMDNIETLTFSENNVIVTTVTLSQTSTGWNILFGSLPYDFLLLENGDMFELENSSGELLLEN